MPELPEVETVRRVLEPQLAGRTVERVTVSRPEVVSRPSAEEFCHRLGGQQISHLERRGKFLRIVLHSGDAVVLHLRMTGSLLLVPAEEPLEKHTHVMMQMSGGRELRFCDPRRFGRLWLFGRGEDDSDSGINKLGLEPFDPGLTGTYLQTYCQRRKRAVKVCLLDQGMVAGIGNIYADEILFAAGIDPRRPANCLNLREWDALAATIPERLSYFIEKNTISPEEYLAGKGRDYRNTPFLQVYGHGKEACPRCRGAFERIVVGGRSTVYCPFCQKES